MNSATVGSKRKRNEDDSHRATQNHRHNDPAGRRGGKSHGRSWADDQVKLNQIQEDERMREWVAQEDDFVLRQAKKKAEIRVREGRANPIDWLAVTLRPIDPTRGVLDDEVEDSEMEFMHPDSVFDGLSEKDLSNLKKDIETYLKLETNSKNRDYWKTMHIICKDKQRKMRSHGHENRVVGAVSSDIDRLLGPKTYEELVKLEGQVRKKLDSDEPIDTDYWQQLLDSLLVWKAKSKMKKVYESVVESRVRSFRLESKQEAERSLKAWAAPSHIGLLSAKTLKHSDPELFLQVPAQDKGLDLQDELVFLGNIASERMRVNKMAYVPSLKNNATKTSMDTIVSSSTKALPYTSNDRFDRSAQISEKQTSNNLFDKEVAKGVAEDEEVFAGEEQVETQHKDQWMGKYHPRKPKYFNRMQMGYEWNKYNQTHYDHDNPPPKVVQGYKFHVFYPDLVDITKAPTFKIIREGGRKKGQSVAPAGEEDTCIIRFMAGAPYEDIAFRIVDRDWDYSAKHDRGFKSTFEKGILTLHFSFKKVFYRK